MNALTWGRVRIHVADAQTSAKEIFRISGSGCTRAAPRTQASVRKTVAETFIKKDVTWMLSMLDTFNTY